MPSRPVPVGPPTTVTPIKSTTKKLPPTITTKIPSTWTVKLWASLVLAFTGSPVTPSNIEKIEHWIYAENGSKWFKVTPSTPNKILNNPLNVGATTSNPNNAFDTLYEAAVTTAREIRNNRDYTAILYSLRNDESETAFAHAVIASTWAASHYYDTINNIIGTPLTNFTTHLTTPTRKAGTGATSGTSGVGSQVTGGEQKPTPVTTALHTLEAPLADIETFITKLDDITFWRRVGIFIGGAALLVVGIALIVHGQKSSESGGGSATADLAGVADLVAA